MADRAVLRQIAAAAVACERSTGLPAELSTAQCVLESGWLKHAPGNNCFGIKYRPRHSGKQTLITTEFRNGRAERVPQDFATFETLADCFVDHARLITLGRPYLRAWSRYLADRDVESLIAGIAPTYATDPKYTGKVLNVLSDEVRAAIEEARI